MTRINKYGVNIFIDGTSVTLTVDELEELLHTAYVAGCKTNENACSEKVEKKFLDCEGLKTVGSSINKFIEQQDEPKKPLSYRDWLSSNGTK